MKRKKLFYFLLSFFVPIFAICATMFLKKYNYKYINNLPDVYQQFIPLFKYLRNTYFEKNVIYYSFFKGMGGNMYSTFFYYLSSPLNVLIIFFKNTNLVLSILMLIKIGLCGLAMYAYLHYKKGKDDLFLLGLSLCYALSGYSICFIHNVFWFDVVYMAPIVMLGIDYILGKDSFVPYVLSLGYCIICNYYIAYMVCIFSVIYFFYEGYLTEKINPKKIKTFILASAISGLMCAIVCIPIFIEMLSLKYRIGCNNIISPHYADITHWFYKVLIGSNSLNSLFNIFDGSPQIYCSVLVVILNIMYFLNVNISKREKVCTGIVYVIFMLTVIFEPYYYFWHGMSETFQCNYRFSFLFCFFAIYIAFKSYYKINDFSKRSKVKIIMVLITFMICNIMMLVSKLYAYYYSGLEIVLSLIFMVVYLVILFVPIKFRKLILFFLVIEIIVNLILSFNILKLYFVSDKLNYDDNCFNYNYDGFSRVNTERFNSSLYCNFGSLSTYITITNPNMIDFNNKIGSLAKYHRIPSYANGIMYYLLGFDYDVRDEHLVPINSNNRLSIGYMVYYKDSIKSKNSISYQQTFLNEMLHTNEKFYEKEELVDKQNGEWILHNDGKDKYLLLNYNRKTTKKILINNTEIPHIEEVYANIQQISKTDKENTKIKFLLNCKLSENNCAYPKLELYELNEEKLEYALNILQHQQLKVIKMEKNVLEGTINVKKNNQYLFLSIPYEKGWNIYVDGKKVKYEKIYDTFIGIKLKKGNHEIKMKFYPCGFKIGCWVSGLGIICFIIYCVIDKKKLT